MRGAVPRPSTRLACNRMGLCDEVRAECAAIASAARSVAIDVDRPGAVEPGPEPALDPERHYLDGSRADVAAFILTLDSINFGSGWFPTLRKRPGCSGYFTIAAALTDRFRAEGPWGAVELRALDATRAGGRARAGRAHPLMRLYAEALRDLGRFLGGRGAARRGRGGGRVGGGAGHDPGAGHALLRRPRLLQAGADHRERPRAGGCRGLTRPRPADDLRRQPGAARPAGRRRAPLRRAPGAPDRRRRAAPAGRGGAGDPGVRGPCLRIVGGGAGGPARTLDVWLWNRGQAPRYKAVPRHRTRTVFY